MANDPPEHPEQEPRPEESRTEYSPEPEQQPGQVPCHPDPQQEYPQQAYPEQAVPQQQAPPPANHPAPGVYDELSSPPPGEAQAESAPLPAPPPPVSQVPPAGNVSADPQAGAPPRRPAGQARVRAGRGVPVRPRTRPARASVDVGGVFMTLLLGVVALAMLGVVAMVVLPKDLSAVQGYPVDPLATEAPKNLLPDLQAILFEPGQEVSFTEQEVNDFLNYRIQGNQGGPFASFLKFQGAYVDFTPGQMEVHVERSLFGFPVTMSTRVRAEPFRGQTRWTASGGSIGKFDMQGKQFHPVVKAYQNLMQAAKDEVQAVRQMAMVRFDADSVTFAR